MKVLHSVLFAQEFYVQKMPTKAGSCRTQRAMEIFSRKELRLAAQEQLGIRALGL
jgi:hypothetical protein